MIEQEIRNIWKNAGKAEQIKLDLSRLMIELNSRLKEVNNKLRKRDLREIGASLFGIPLHIYFFFLVPFPITRIGIVLIILWFVFVIYKIRSASKLSQNVDIEDSYVNQLKQQKNHLVAQFKLIDSVLYWYILPPFIGNAICILGFGEPTEFGFDNWLVNSLPMDTTGKLSTILLLAVFYAFIYRMNKKAAKKNIQPIIQDINRIEAELEI